MASEIFNGKRFSTYFKYDLRRLWDNNGKAALMLGFISVICYVIWVIFGLVFTKEWSAPTVPARVAFFFVGSVILVLYQTRTYGYLTEKKAGQAWLMNPASAFEKFISMLIITVILFPLAYLVSYFALDSIIALFDKTAGGPLLAGFSQVSDKALEAFSEAREAGYNFNIALLCIPIVLQIIADILYFLLCGISFKKWKIMGGIGILFALLSVTTPFISRLAVRVSPTMEGLSENPDPTALMGMYNFVMTAGIVLDALIVIGLGVGIYYRIKTLKH